MDQRVTTREAEATPTATRPRHPAGDRQAWAACSEGASQLASPGNPALRCGKAGGEAGGAARIAVALGWLSAALMTLPVAAPIAAAATAPAPAMQATPMSDDDRMAVARLVTLLLAVLAAGGGKANATDTEAKLTYTIDQAQVSCSVITAALHEILSGPNRLSGMQRAALSDVAKTLSSCPTGGTAATQSAAFGDLGGGLGLGGGGSNYQGGQ